MCSYSVKSQLKRNPRCSRLPLSTQLAGRPMTMANRTPLFASRHLADDRRYAPTKVTHKTRQTLISPLISLSFPRRLKNTTDHHPPLISTFKLIPLVGGRQEDKATRRSNPRSIFLPVVPTADSLSPLRLEPHSIKRCHLNQR